MQWLLGNRLRRIHFKLYRLFLCRRNVHIFRILRFQVSLWWHVHICSIIYAPCLKSALVRGLRIISFCHYQRSLSIRWTFYYWICLWKIVNPLHSGQLRSCRRWSLQSFFGILIRRILNLMIHINFDVIKFQIVRIIYRLSALKQYHLSLIIVFIELYLFNLL